MIKIYDRQNKKYITEEQYGQKYLSILYNTLYGRILSKIILNPITSEFIGLYKKSKLSRKDINKIIKDYNIDMTLYETKEYKSFNDFFTRKIILKNRKLIENDNYFISPSDSKLLVYKITNDNILNIKGSTYTLNELVKNKIDISKYNNGLCLIFRLSMDNYHHYCYPDNGKILRNFKIKGKLHTVSSISKKHKVYKENKREVSILKTENFDELIYIEVGALLVGEIINNKDIKFKKGEEKGYFSLGGSTIIILVKENILKIDDDILNNSKKGIETIVKYREKIGEKL